MEENFKCTKCEASFDSQQALNDHSNAKHYEAPKQKFTAKFKKPATYLIILLILIGGLSLTYRWAASTPHIGPVGSTHIHQDFKVYLNGNQLDFSQQKYQVRAPYAHVEDNDGDVIHVHATGVTLGMFIDSLDMQLTNNCFKTDDGTSYCNNGNNTLKFYVNNVPNTQFNKYELRELDKILISYGAENETAIQMQLNTITNKAIEESQKAANEAL
ncbi:MAG: hypothetical protein Q8R15_00090 [Candidatus Micrarchaeota archaeon]|nr:hypothetical protein [Candidatus Micrarchaeota archaeon]